MIKWYHKDGPFYNLYVRHGTVKLTKTANTCCLKQPWPWYNCVYICIKSGMDNIQPAGQIWPIEGVHPCIKASHFWNKISIRMWQNQPILKHVLTKYVSHMLLSESHSRCCFSHSKTISFKFEQNSFFSRFLFDRFSNSFRRHSSNLSFDLQGPDARTQIRQVRRKRQT